MKKKIFVCALIAVCLSIMAYSTVAYFTHEEKATNVITVGNIKIELQHLTMDDSEGELTAVIDNVVAINPGTAVSRVVQVKNTGDHGAWVRISVEKLIELAKGIDGQPDSSLIGLDINTEYWSEFDGYYYYTQPLEAGQTTQPLFTQISFSSDMGNIYQNSSANVEITAYAVQTVHNGETVFDAAGWPQKN